MSSFQAEYTQDSEKKQASAPYLFVFAGYLFVHLQKRVLSGRLLLREEEGKGKLAFRLNSCEARREAVSYYLEKNGFSPLPRPLHTKLV
ncbi:hypothetical protein [Ktedonobacter sp. SOSP1-52]|uniref:hypothetical protein n=1 Tax=Ktedonobacter sp. SOSP1-52 TaxID=2778366 RepID=UPI001915CD28|nr:hypothetical protein [Ktedonobacter sp. SOSP1-52]